MHCDIDLHLSSVVRRPSGRLEAMKLMKIMDNMLEKATVDWQREELIDIYQVGSLPLWLI